MKEAFFQENVLVIFNGGKEMKKVKEKILSFVMSFVLAVGLMAVPSNMQQVYAAEITSAEVESVSTVTIDPFTVGTISGIATEDAKDWYEFTPDHDGLIDTEELVKYTHWELFRYENGSWVSMGGLHNNDLIKGNKYRLAVWYRDGQEYELSFIPVDDVLPTAKNATKVSVNKEISERIRSIQDIDWYKFDTGKNNIIGIFDAGLHEKTHIDVYSYDSESDKDRLVTGDHDGFAWVKVKPHTTYYIKVKDEVWRYVGNEPFDYKFVISAKYDVGDTNKTAEKIKVGKAYKCDAYSDEDVDVYTFKATKTGTVKIAGSVTSSWSYRNEIKIVAAQKGSVSVALTKGGLKENFSESFKVKKGKTYYITVTAGIRDTEYQFKCKYGK